MISVIIVAAGGSRRMGFDKLSADLGGTPVIARTLSAFDRCDAVSEIIVVTSKDRFDFIRQLGISKLATITEGGAERHLSVWNGIAETSAEYPLIAVHDGARPLVSPRMIEKCAATALEMGAATLAHRVVDTLKRSSKNGLEVAESVSRDDLWAMETPQIFQRDILTNAYHQVIENNSLVTDEVSAVQAAGDPVYFVENTEPNLKITVAGDLDLAKAFITSK